MSLISSFASETTFSCMSSTCIDDESNIFINVLFHFIKVDLVKMQMETKRLLRLLDVTLTLAVLAEQRFLRTGMLIMNQFHIVVVQLPALM
jgi:hypothetical protein